MGPSPSTLWPEIAPQWILNLPEWLEDICFNIYKCFFFDERYTYYIRGLSNTLLLTLLALLMGIVLGVIVAMVRSTWDKNGSEMQGLPKFILRIANSICNIYLTVIREIGRAHV